VLRLPEQVDPQWRYFGYIRSYQANRPSVIVNGSHAQGEMKMVPKRRRITSLAIASALAVISFIWFANRARAQAQAESTSGFLAYGIVGITSGQTLRLNAVSVNVGHDVPVELLFLDSQGNVVGRSVDKLTPGHATLLDFRPPSAPALTRKRVRALVRWSTALGTNGYVIPSLEVIDDATGRTTLAWPNPEG
jgi:hypothetical protein